MRLVILGGGPAGYSAAEAASAIGADVTLIEDQALGGNATTWDAIPSKTLLHSASTMAAVDRADDIGIAFEHGRPHVDLLRAIARARYVAMFQTRGIRTRLEGTAARIVIGTGAVGPDGVVHVTHRDGGEEQIPYDRLVICSGAGPWEPPFAAVDHDRVITTREVLNLRRLPEHLLVVGAGPTGCEYAEFFTSAGVHVTLLSARDQILPNEDRDVAGVVEEAFLSRGVDLQFSCRASSVELLEGGGVSVTAADGRSFTGSHAIICMGMRARTAGLGLETIGLETDDRGSIVVNQHMCTSNADVYAAGDVAGGMMLASTAAMQGRHAALEALGAIHEPVHLEAIPWTIFTRPEVSSVGLNEAGARRLGRNVVVTRHYLRSNPRAVIAGLREGLIKLVFDPDSGQILGGSIVGYRACEVITTLALAVGAELTVTQLANTGTVTPAMSESLQRAAERAVTSRLAPAR